MSGSTAGMALLLAYRFVGSGVQPHSADSAQQILSSHDVISGLAPDRYGTH
ncbi:hypothetical protein [Erwinia mallotivora]|uniref:hypothetical protein n=1 Tax=Erwinia mallotivora TaxID=69222 RepID=UPI0021C077FD|nr:hypothetical protein [Erwinia mallotivora]